MSGDYSLSTINSVLDLAKAEAGKLELHEGTIDPMLVIDAVIRMVGSLADAGGVEIQKQVSSLPALRADEVKIRQILINLLSNAIKFTPAGGAVVISAEVTAEGDLEVRVSDTGVGIAPEELAKVLEPFYQAPNSKAERVPGTGLGLPLAAAMTELHGGKLVLESVLNHGTTATVRLPKDRLVPRSSVQAVS